MKIMLLLYPVVKDVEFLTVDNKGFFCYLVTWFDPWFYCYVFIVSLEIRESNEVKNKILKLKAFKKEILSAFVGFLDEHFPPIEEGENTKNKVRLFFTY